MEENKIDPYQILGFVILMIAFVWYIYTVPELESDRSSNQSIVINEDDQVFKSDNENDMQSLNDLIVSEKSDDQAVDLLNKIRMITIVTSVSVISMTSNVEKSDWVR